MSFYNRGQQVQIQQQSVPNGIHEFGNTLGFGGQNNAGNGGNASNGGYLYNNTNSPLGSNAMINHGQVQNPGFNNLNLSTRNLDFPPSSFGSSVNNTGSTTLSNPTTSSSTQPRLVQSNNIISPSLNFASLYSNRARFNASKGFDLEDDLEFCPEIHEHFLSQTTSSTSSQGTGNSSNFTHRKFNPYTSSSFSPQVSPTSANAMTTTASSPTSTKQTVSNNSSTTPKSNNPNDFRTITPRAKKVLEIVNPVTGLRVSSPAPYKW